MSAQTMSALLAAAFADLPKPKPPSPAHAVELQAHEWQQSLGKRQRDASAAADWIVDAAVLLQRCPLAVRQALPAHADNLAAMTDALRDLLGDARGFYGKEGA